MSAGGERTIKAADFFVDMLTTALEPGEILREIRIATPSGRFGQAYLKVPQPASGFAVVGVAVSLALDANGTCQSAERRHHWRRIEGLSSDCRRTALLREAILTNKPLPQRRPTPPMVFR